MRILALEPYYTGSHQAFLEGWIARSRHAWTVQSLPGRSWKWRMRHSALTFAETVRQRLEAGQRWDAVFCTDMLDLAQWKGLAPHTVAGLPSILYFHENQLLYPDPHGRERDLHFAYTNFTSACAADAIWWNTRFHRDAFLNAMGELLRHMPDHQPLPMLDVLRRRSDIQPQGLAPDVFLKRLHRAPGPLRILWAARWEDDKGPETFFNAIACLEGTGTDYRLLVVGEHGKQSPPVFEEAARFFRHRIDRWGYQPTRQEYLDTLQAADVIVSTARQEFFGVAVAEAVAAGCYPVVPTRLAYPDVLDASAHPDWFYDGDVNTLAWRLETLAARLERTGSVWDSDPEAGPRTVARFRWDTLAPRLDEALEHACSATAAARPAAPVRAGAPTSPTGSRPMDG